MARKSRKGKVQRESDAKRPDPGGDQGGEVIDMNKAISLLKTTRPTFYRWLRAGKIRGMKVGRQWRFYRDDIERFLRGEEPKIDLPADIGPLIATLCGRIAKAGGKEAVGEEEERPVARAITLTVKLGVVMGASDIHIGPHREEDGRESVAVLRYRIDGVLQEVARIDMRLLPAIMEQWKRMASCDIHEKQLPQDGRIRMKIEEPKPGKEIDMRICFLPAGLGESVTVRILDPAAVVLKLDDLDYALADRERLLRALKSPWGIIFLAGPTGSGKTTVLYSCVNEVSGPHIKTMAVEDPVEYILPWVTQIPIKPSVGLTFEMVLRSMLRSDPDVILVGEVRNRETLLIAQQAALTGHLVMTTLHTDEAATTLKRMVDIGSDPFLVADSTKLIVAQRLIRKLCRHCSTKDAPTATQLDMAAETARNGGLDWDSLEASFRKAVGCDKCSGTGFKGRTVAAEMLEVTPEIEKALRTGASVEEMRAIAIQQGMTTMAADGIRRAARGETALSEVMRMRV